MCGGNAVMPTPPSVNCDLAQYQQCTTACGTQAVTACTCMAGVATPMHTCAGGMMVDPNAGTCFDKLQNGDELGVDCGGRCALACNVNNMATACSSDQSAACFAVCEPNPVKQCQCTAANANAVCGSSDGPATPASRAHVSLLALALAAMAALLYSRQ